MLKWIQQAFSRTLSLHEILDRLEASVGTSRFDYWNNIVRENLLYYLDDAISIFQQADERRHWLWDYLQGERQDAVIPEDYYTTLLTIALTALDPNDRVRAILLIEWKLFLPHSTIRDYLDQWQGLDASVHDVWQDIVAIINETDPSP